MINIEIFSVPGCSKCAAANVLLEQAVSQLCSNDIAWRNVNILDEIGYAVELGVLSPPAIAINGRLAFTSLPSAAALLAEIQKQLP